MDKHLLIIFFTVILCSTSALKIAELRVPELVNIRELDSVILDCDFVIGNDTDGLVLQWHFKEQLIYQWIPSSAPQVLGIFRDKLDLNYTVNDEPYTMYRALKINNLSLNLTGDYKCKVSTFSDEDTMTNKMTMFEPPKVIEMLQLKSDDEFVQIVCSVFEMFPEPSLNISYSGSAIEETAETVVTENDEGLYNVTTLITFKDDILDSPTIFVCKISLPDTDYMQKKQLIYYPGSITTTTELYVDYDSTPVIPETEDKSGVPVVGVSWIPLIFVVLTTLLLT